MRPADCRRALALLSLLLVNFGALSAEPPTGPQTEKRFPPLQVPAGFRATLFACDPLIEYPSVIAPGFRSGTVLVAIDYMTGLGTEIVRRDEIRLLEDTDGDGYADKATVFASGFNSIQGLAHHNGTVYVMHAPYLTALRDTRGTGKADERRDLIVGLGLSPEQDQIRLHNANGVVVGHDGWLYLALGDHGCNVVRPEGDRLVLEGGGILRCRPDGRDLHVFSRGLRNIYDVALDADLNVFVRDNENDGGTYKVRLCHSFFGADHGYPYLYDERPAEALPPVAELGLGAPAGGLCYLERQFPQEYRGQLFFCEWGRAVVRSPLRKSGATFAALKESDFIAGAANDPYGFKPTDLIVDRDGSLFVSDWGDGQRPRRGRGRIYHIRYAGNDPAKTPGRVPDAKSSLDQLVGQLNSESYLARWDAQQALASRGKDGVTAVLNAIKEERLEINGRLHAIWIVAGVDGSKAVDWLLRVAQNDPEPRIQAQALRAAADLTDPVLTGHRLDAGRGDEAIARRIADFADANRDPRVRLEAIIALGRLHWKDAPSYLHRTTKNSEPAVAHAAQWTIRRADNWSAVLKLLDLPRTEAIREIALRSVADQYEEEIVDGLIDRLKRDADAGRRLDYADLLTRVHKKPGAWVYWGFRPTPRTAATQSWKCTEKIARALDDTLARLEPAGRTTLLRRMVREKIPASAGTLTKFIESERDAERVAVLLKALGELPDKDALSPLELVVRDVKHTAANRLSATSAYLMALKPADDKRLLATAEAVEDGPVLAELLRATGTRKMRTAVTLLCRKVDSGNADVRVGAVAALAELGPPDARLPAEKLLGDPDARVRAAAARAAGKLELTSASERLLALARGPAAEVRSASLIALRQLGDRRAIDVAVAALADRDTANSALEYLARLGGPAQVAAIVESAERDPSLDRLSTVAKHLAGWLAREDWTPAERVVLQQAVARLHGHSGALMVWRVSGPHSREDAASDLRSLAGATSADANRLTSKWRVALSSGAESRVLFGPVKNPNDIWLAYAEAEVPANSQFDFIVASTGLEAIWLNDKSVFQRGKEGVAGPYPDRIEANLEKGTNRIVVRLDQAKTTAEFRLRIRRKNSVPQQERYAAAAMTRTGNAARGREIFFNAEKSQCIKCHRVGDRGERFGPELTGLGSRFSKVYIIESILEPSRTIAPSFESTIFDLKNERSITGLKVEETETSLVLIDAQAKKHTIPKSDIEARRRSTLSTMPEGFEKILTEDEFVDLISFLANLKVEKEK